jgi:hypothetical protein
MSEKLVAYIINESRGPEQDAVIMKATPSVVRFKVPVLQEEGIQNRNGRVYGWDVLSEGVNHPYLQERLRTGTLYAECGHPREQTVERQIHIDRDNITCIIKEIEMRRPIVVGALVETCATRKGRDLRGLIVENGCKVAFSMRGLGRVVEQGGVIHVQRPLRIVTWDEVVHPSVPNAYMGELVANESSQKLVGESMTVLNEDAFARFILGSSPGAQNALDAMGIDPNAEGATLAVNEDGLLVVDGGPLAGGDRVICLTESKLRRAADDYLLALGRKKAAVQR